MRYSKAAALFEDEPRWQVSVLDYINPHPQGIGNSLLYIIPRMARCRVSYMSQLLRMSIMRLVSLLNIHMEEEIMKAHSNHLTRCPCIRQ